MRQKGFTLIEIMVVVVIISLLMALVIPILGQVSEKARIQTTRALISDISRASEAFNSCFGYYPKDYLGNFSYISSESGTQDEQIKMKSSSVLLLGLTHSFIDYPKLASQSPSKGRGPFYDQLRVGDNILRYDDLQYPDMDLDPKNPYAFTMLTSIGDDSSPCAGKSAYIIIDPWGNGLVYDEKKAHRLYSQGKTTQNNEYEKKDYVHIEFGDASSGMDAALKLPYILYSLGPNATDDTDNGSTSGAIDHGDDIGNW